MDGTIAEKQLVKRFWRYFGIFSISLLLIIIPSYFMFGPTGPLIADNADAISNYLNTLIGLPITLAGSIIAILLAYKAVHMSERQEARDAIVLYEASVRELYDTYHNVKVAFIEYYSSIYECVSLYVDITEIANDCNEKPILHDRLLELENIVNNNRENFIRSVMLISKSKLAAGLIEEKLGQFIDDIEYILDLDNADQEGLDFQSYLAGFHLLPMKDLSNLALALNALNRRKAIRNLIRDNYYDKPIKFKKTSENVELDPDWPTTADWEEILTNPVNNEYEERSSINIMLLTGLHLCSNKAERKEFDGEVLSIEGYEYRNMGAIFLCALFRSFPTTDDVIDNTSNLYLIDKNNLHDRLEHIRHNYNFDEIIPKPFVLYSEFMMSHVQIEALRNWTSPRFYWRHHDFNQWLIER
jgi:hypothetical protein